MYCASLTVAPKLQQAPDEPDLPEGRSGGLEQLQPADLLERGLSDGGAQLPDAGPCHAAQPGKVRVQRKLWVRTLPRLVMPLSFIFKTCIDYKRCTICLIVLTICICC